MSTLILRRAFLVGFLIFLIANPITLASQSPMEFMESCKDDEFGKTIVSTLELEFQNKSPSNYIIRVFKDMLRMVQSDKLKGQQKHRKYQEECVSSQKSMKAELGKHTRSIVDQQKLIRNAQSKLTWNQQRKDSQTRQLKEYKGNLEKLTLQRNSEVTEFDKKIKEINEALFVLQAGRGILQNKVFKKKAALIQLRDQFRDYVKKMSAEVDGKSDYMGRGYVALVEMAADAVEKAAPKSSNGAKVIAMVQSLIDELERVKNLEYVAQKTRGKNFIAVQRQYQKNIDSATKAVQSTSNSINALQQRIDYSKSRIAEADKSIAQKKEQLKKTKKVCVEENETFKKTDAKLEHDEQLITFAIELLQENWEDFKQIIQENSQEERPKKSKAKKEKK